MTAGRESWTTPLHALSARDIIAGMDKLERHREQVVASVGPLPPERLATSAAGGRWLLEPVLARRAAPPFACSAMDGYAVRSVDTAGAMRLRVVRALFAGDLPGAAIAAGE